MTLKVGQVLYVVITKQTVVYPMQVVEEIVKKTLNGTETDYVLKAGGSDSKTINLKDIQGEVFETSSRAREVLTERATRSIAKIVENAAAKAKEWYPGSFESSTEESIIDELRSSANSSTPKPASSNGSGPTVDLGNGIIGKVKLPDVLSG